MPDVEIDVRPPPKPSSWAAAFLMPAEPRDWAANWPLPSAPAGPSAVVAAATSGRRCHDVRATDDSVWLPAWIGGSVLRARRHRARTRSPGYLRVAGFHRGGPARRGTQSRHVVGGEDIQVALHGGRCGLGLQIYVGKGSIAHRSPLGVLDVHHVCQA